MTEKLLKIFYKYKELILYVFFGGMTTLVNFLIYYPLIWWTDVNYLWANVLSWIGAVIFAFFTNKAYVFEDKTNTFSAYLKKFIAFIAARLFSLGAETLFMYIGVDMMNVGEGIVKIPVAVIVVILNYITSKLFVFRKK